MEALCRSLLPFRPQFSYLQNGGLGWVIAKGSESTIYIQWLKNERGWAGGLTREQTPEITQPSPSHSSNQREN